MLTEQHKAVLITIFYMGKLEEFGLIEGNGIGITTKGFDEAYDLYKSGFKITKEEMGTCLKGIMEGASSKIILQFLELAFHMQEVGIDEMKKQIAEM